MSMVNGNNMTLYFENQEIDGGQEAPLSSQIGIEDLSPEVLTMILGYVTSHTNKKSMLDCRTVKKQWKEILDFIIEKRIISGELEAFPEIRIQDINDRKEVQVDLCPTRFPAGRNPFPFNSIHLSDPFENIVPPHPLSSLSDFATGFGGYLTSFTSSDTPHISLNAVAQLLSSTPNLRRLNLVNVMDTLFLANDVDIVVPTAPPLPHLTFLQLTIRRRFPTNYRRANILLIWLIGAYAEQVVKLHLESEFPFPPFLACYQYQHDGLENKMYPIVTTSESAFQNLTELKINRPSKDFLTLSETPKLQHLELLEIFRENDATLEDVDIFISKCRRTLKTLKVTSSSNELRTEEELKNYLERRVEQVGFPRLMTVAIQYPCMDLEEMILYTFLSKFSALKIIRLLCFRPHRFDSKERVNLSENATDHKNRNDKIRTLKNWLPPLYQRMCGIKNRTTAALSARKDLIAGFRNEPEQVREFLDQVQQLDADILVLRADMIIAECERAVIYNELAALGVNKKEAMVQQFLERRAFWNSFRNLRTVFVNSGDQLDGDVCVVRRTNDV